LAHLLTSEISQLVNKDIGYKGNTNNISYSISNRQIFDQETTINEEKPEFADYCCQIFQIV
jgi:hypothetical protein